MAVKSEHACRFLATITVIFMALFGLVILPDMNEGQPTRTSNIYVPVLCDGTPVPDAWVNLTEVHTGVVIAASYSVTRAAYIVATPPSGFYRVDVVGVDQYDAMNARELSFDGRNNVTVTPVDLLALPNKIYTIAVTVVDSGANPINGASVFIYDETARETVASAYSTTNISGNTSISMFNTTLIPGHEFYVVVKKFNFEMNVTAVSITSSSSIVVELAASKRVTCFVTDAEGPALGVVAYLVNKDSSIPWVKRVTRAQGAALAFDAYDGDFMFVVDAEGAAAFSQDITVTSSVALSIPMLSTQTMRVAEHDIAYGADFTSFSLGVSGAWPYDLAHPGLMYSDMGSLRMQIDLVLGDGDGALEISEVNAFVLKTYNWGTEYVATDTLLLLNETIYYSDGGTFIGYPFQLSEGSVHLADSVLFAYSCDYVAIPGGIDVGALEYTTIAYARYDTAVIDNRYAITLPAGYELVANNSQYTDVSGYLTVYLDPPAGPSTNEQIEMFIEASEAPSAVAWVAQSPGVAHAELDENGTLVRCIVRVGPNITLNSSGSFDPNGNPLMYTWDFDDGSPPLSTGNTSCVHVFATSASSRAVSLTVTDVSGMYNVTEVRVVCDALDPDPVISASGAIVNMTVDSITINQGDYLTVNATSSSDDAAVVGDGMGLIDSVQFDWGDGNVSSRIWWTSEQQNTSHAFERAGVYALELNVTDVTGHWSRRTIQVFVLDITPPIPVAMIYPSSVMLGETVYLDATLSTDADGTIESYLWTFMDDGVPVTLVGANVSYTFTSEPQVVTVTLNCTDSNGNWATTSRIVVVSGVIPEFQAFMMPFIVLATLLLVLRLRPRRV